MPSPDDMNGRPQSSDDAQRMYADYIRSIRPTARERPSTEMSPMDELRLVTRAQVRDMKHDDVDTIVSELYQRKRISEDALRDCLQGDSNRLADEIERGVMVFGCDERPQDRGKSVGATRHQSVLEQMHDMLEWGKKYRGEMGEYHGSCLVSDEGKLLAYLTLLEPPPSPVSQQYQRYVCSMLEQGVTGGDMQYVKDGKKEKLIKGIETTVIFDTIISDCRHAASRLFAEDATKILERRPELTRLLLYRLLDLDIRDSGSGKMVFDEDLSAENMRSYRFFVDRACKFLAIDHNNFGGPEAERIVDNHTLKLNPTWVWMGGRLPEVAAKSKDLWEAKLSGSTRK